MAEKNNGFRRLSDEDMEQIRGGVQTPGSQESASRCPVCGSMVSDSIFAAHKAECQKKSTASKNGGALFPLLLRFIGK